jgi:hypothetical protein
MQKKIPKNIFGDTLSVAGILSFPNPQKTRNLRGLRNYYLSLEMSSFLALIFIL